MEIKAQLLQPFNEEEKINFIVEQNHNNGYEIRETETALEAWGYTEEEIQAQERERIAKLSMTKREMFLGLYQAKGITPDMLKAQITEPQALIEFEYANDYYRGNPLIDVIGGQLGFTSEQLDKFFETKEYKYLTTCKLTIKPIPAEATITGAGDYPYGTIVDVVVECEGYITHTETVTLTEDVTLNITLDEVQDENTTDTAE